jgi:hypothetical protein
VSEPRFTIGNPNGNNAAWVYDGNTKIAKIEEAKGDSVLSLVSLAQRAETLTRRVEELEGVVDNLPPDLMQVARNLTEAHDVHMRYMYGVDHGGGKPRCEVCRQIRQLTQAAALAAKGVARD